MDALNRVLESLFSVRIVDDLNDTASTRTHRTRRKARSHDRDRHTRRRSGEMRERDVRIHDNLEDLRRDNREYKRKIEKLQKDLDHAKEDVERYRRKRKEAEEQKALFADQNKELEERLDILKDHHARAVEDFENLRISPQLFASPPAPPPIPLPPAFGFPLEDRHGALRKLEEKEEDLRALRVFLDKTDEVPGAEVIRLVSDLNNEIEILAATVVDDVQFEKRWEQQQAEAITPSSELENGFGSQLCQSLVAGDHDHSSDPTLIQLAIQAWEVYCCRRVLEAFVLGLYPDTDETLWGAFKKMQEKEPQQVAARWRSLARTYLKASQNESGSSFDEATQRLVRENVEGISFILCFAGCKEPFRPDPNTIQTIFGSKVEWIVHLASNLATTLREKIMSAEFELVMELPGASFDPEEMDDFSRERWRDTSQPAEEAKHGVGAEILCTAAFGLKCTSERRPIHDDGSVGATVTERRLLMKPRVILPSVIELMKREESGSSTA